MGRAFHGGLAAMDTILLSGARGQWDRGLRPCRANSFLSRAPAGQALARAWGLGVGAGPCLSSPCSHGHLAPAPPTQPCPGPRAAGGLQAGRAGQGSSGSRVPP